MSSLMSLLLVSCSVGMDNFAAAIGIGLKGLDARTRLQTGVIFGFFEGLMPVVGLLVGRELADVLGSSGRYVGAGLLILMGCYGLWKTYRERREQDEMPARKTPGHGRRQNLRRLTLVGFVLSMDNLVVGFALSLLHISILLAAGVIACVSVALSLAGLELGRHLGQCFEAWSELLGSVVLILVGVVIVSGVL